MKKLMIGVLALSFMSVNAFASKAKLQALGQSVDGSLFVDDARNIFFNPANLNYHKDFITFEAGASAATDAAATPNSEGGFVKSRGNMVFGVHFGNQDETIKAVRSDSPSTTNLNPVEGNIVDLFFGGDAGVLWGIDLSYADYKDEQAAAEIEGSFLRSKIGLISGNIESFLDFSLQDKAEEEGVAEVEIKSSYDVLFAYNLRSDAKAYIRYAAIEATEKEVDDENLKISSTEIGYGRIKNLNNKAVLNYNISYNSSSEENTGFTENDAATEKSIPVVVGLQYKAKDWLTLLGSISQEIYSENEAANGDKSTNANSTDVYAGMTFHFGDLVIDGLIGNSVGGAATAADTSGGNGSLRTDNLMSRVSATYKF